MKKILILIFLVAISLSVFACDGDDGVNGLTGPSGVGELTQTTCGDDKVLKSVPHATTGVVTLTCTDIPE